MLNYNDECGNDLNNLFGLCISDSDKNSDRTGNINELRNHSKKR